MSNNGIVSKIEDIIGVDNVDGIIAIFEIKENKADTLIYYNGSEVQLSKLMEILLKGSPDFVEAVEIALANHYAEEAFDQG